MGDPRTGIHKERMLGRKDLTDLAAQVVLAVCPFRVI